jgi:hypothetical protein
VRARAQTPDTSLLIRRTVQTCERSFLKQHRQRVLECTDSNWDSWELLYTRSCHMWVRLLPGIDSILCRHLTDMYSRRRHLYWALDGLCRYGTVTQLLVQNLVTLKLFFYSCLFQLWKWTWSWWAPLWEPHHWMRIDIDKEGYGGVHNICFLPMPAA